MIQIVCPSGLAGMVRGMKTREANMLANQRAIREGLAFDGILGNCWLNTTDVGVYVDRGIDVGKPILPEQWPNLLQCDKFYALIQIRIATFGDDYTFKQRCPRCEKTFEWVVPLSDLDVKPLPESSRATILGKKHFEAAFLDGQKYRFNLPTGADEIKLQKARIKRKNEEMTVGIDLRIVDIDGVDAKDKYRFLDDLAMPEVLNVKNTVEAANGGVETAIDVECTFCEWELRVELPLGVNFFLPEQKR